MNNGKDDEQETQDRADFWRGWHSKRKQLERQQAELKEQQQKLLKGQLQLRLKEQQQRQWHKQLERKQKEPNQNRLRGPVHKPQARFDRAVDDRIRWFLRKWILRGFQVMIAGASIIVIVSKCVSLMAN